MFDDGGRVRFWQEMGETLGEKEPRVAYIFKHLLSDRREGEMDIFRALLKALTPGRQPHVNADVEYGELVDVWTLKKGEQVLDDKWGLHLRYQGVDAMLLAPSPAIWPPPLELVSPSLLASAGASVCWEVMWEKACPTKDELEGTLKFLAKEREDWSGITFFRKGRPSSVVYDLAKNKSELVYL